MNESMLLRYLTHPGRAQITLLNDNKLFVRYKDPRKGYRILENADLQKFVVGLWAELENKLQPQKSLELHPREKTDWFDQVLESKQKRPAPALSRVDLASVVTDPRQSVRPVRHARKTQPQKMKAEKRRSKNLLGPSINKFPAERWPAEPLVECLPLDEALVVKQLHPKGGVSMTVAALKCQIFTKISPELQVEETHSVPYASISFDAETLLKLDVLLPDSPLLDMKLPEQIHVSPLIIFFRSLEQSSYCVNVMVYMNSLPLMDAHEINLKRTLRIIRETGREEAGPLPIGGLLQFDRYMLHELLVQQRLSSRGRFLCAPPENVLPIQFQFYRDMTQKYSADPTLGFPCTEDQRLDLEAIAEDASFEWEMFIRRFTFGGLGACSFGKPAEAMAPLLPASKTMRLLVERVRIHCPCFSLSQLTAIASR